MELLIQTPTAYVGKIIDVSPIIGPNGEERYLFATPHGSVFELSGNEMDEPTLEDLDYLLELEDRAKKDEKVLYGGQVAIDETKRILAKKAS